MKSLGMGLTALATACILSALALGLIDLSRNPQWLKAAHPPMCFANRC